MVKSVSVSLVDDALSRTGGPGPRRDVEAIADSMPADLRAEFVAAINNRNVPASGLSRALASRGYKVSAQSISRYRLAGGVLA